MLWKQMDIYIPKLDGKAVVGLTASMGLLQLARPGLHWILVGQATNYQAQLVKANS